MYIKRPARWLLALWTLAFFAGPAWAAQVPANSNLDYQTPTQSYENGSPPFAESNPQSPGLFGSLNPFHSLGFEPSMEWFGPAETSTYGNGPRSRIGFFGSYERVYWSLSRPTTTTIGSTTAAGPNISTIGTFLFPPQAFPALNSMDTGFLQANGAWGNRIELGYVDTDNYGWMIGVLDHVSQGQFRNASNVELQFNDPAGLLNGFIPGPLGFPINLGKMTTQFTTLQAKNVATLNGVELMRMYRAPRLHGGGYFELLYGLRYLQLADTFNVNASNTTANSTSSTTTTTTTAFNPLSDSTWATRTQNNMLGPQIGTRFAHQRGRWITSLELRGTAAINFQSVHQTTNLGTNVLNNIAMFGTTSAIATPLTFAGFGTNTTAHAYTFAPIGEVRVQTVLTLTSNVGLKIGYTGLFIDNITRASNRVDYTGQNLISITPGGLHQIFWAQGINMGIEINR